jgi:signal transduction histidine kinase
MEFSKILSHELGNPLQMLSGISEILFENKQDG